ncbi:MAG: hypothetical protein U0703_11830 [Anaerolineae bacterium]
MPFSQSEYLTILTHAPGEAVKALAEDVILVLGDLTVVRSRTGLVMLPYVDSAQGAVFHLGEVLTAEGHIRLEAVLRATARSSGATSPSRWR